MILLDFSNIFMACVHQNIRASKQPSSMYTGNVESENGISEDLLRHMVLNSIRSINKNFRGKYGDLIICCDSKAPWRETYFPHYKHKRKKKRKEDSVDWDAVYKFKNVMIAELDEFFPYPIISVENAEADDVIAVLSHIANDIEEDTVIVGNDKDFVQLITEYVSLYAKAKDILYVQKDDSQVSSLEEYF